MGKNNNYTILYSLLALACFGVGGIALHKAKEDFAVGMACAVPPIWMGIRLARKAIRITELEKMDFGLGDIDSELIDFNNIDNNADAIMQALNKSGLLQKTVQSSSDNPVPQVIVGFKSQKPVSEDMLRHLTYPTIAANTPKTIYSPLDETDIRRLLTKFDIGYWTGYHQKKFLQFIIDASHKHPSVARIFREKTPLISAGYMRANPIVKGHLDRLNPNVVRLSITEDIESNMIGDTVYHEFIHAIQDKHTTFADVNYSLYRGPYQMLLESHAKALELIGTDCPFAVNMVEGMLQKLNMVKTTLSPESKGFIEEMCAGILMKCLISSDKDERYQLVQDHCGIPAEYFADLNQYCNNWHVAYFSADLSDLYAYSRVNNLSDQPQRDQIVVKSFENWFSMMTHIRQSTCHKLSLQEIQMMKNVISHHIHFFEKD